MPITIQDTYLTDYVPGFPGMLANGETQNRISRTIEDAAGVAFGRAVFSGVGDHGATATPAASAFLGITIADVGIVPAIGGTADVYPQYSSASLLDMGTIWVTAGSATTDKAAVYVTSAGAFTTTSAGNTAIPATFVDTVASGAPVRIRVVQ